MSIKIDERVEGWGFMFNTKKAHYFRKGTSLCGGWLALGTPVWESNQETGISADTGTCKSCWKKRTAEEKP